MADVNEWNRHIIEWFRANDGKVGGHFEGVPLLILHTTGARSGQTRMNPLVYQADGDRIAGPVRRRGFRRLPSTSRRAPGRSR
jgi:hypothetical protein